MSDEKIKNSEKKEDEFLKNKNKHHDKYEQFQWENKDLLQNGPVSDSHRSCRDILCCLIFLAFIAGCVVVTGLGFNQGNPNLVLYPYDEDARQCGRVGNTTNSNLTNYPYLYFYAAATNAKSYNITGIAQGVCVSSCPTNYTSTLDCAPTINNPNCHVDFWNYYVSVSFLGRFCIPDPLYVNTTAASDIKSIVINGTTYVEQSNNTQATSSSLISLNIINSDELISWITDLVTCWPIILASLGYALVITIIYMLLVKCCAGVIAYITIALILAALAGLGYVFQARIDYYVSIQDANYTLTMKVLCGLFYSLAIIWLLMILFMCNRIRLAIALVSVTADYLGSVWSVFFVPFMFYLLSAVYYAYWVALSVFLYSAGTVNKSSSTFLPSVTWTSTTRYAWWYHLFALFYVNAFLNAFSQFVLASTACIWYFERGIEGGASRPVTRSFYRGFRYHIGSIAFGSLIVAIIRFMMAVVEYVKQKVDPQGTSQAGRIYKCLLTCCQCCLECVARLCEFINKHAYIQIALKGDSFCVSAWEGFGLVFRNLGRWSMLFLIGGFFNIIGILFISSCSGLIGYLLITRIPEFNDKLNSPVIGAIGFIIGAISMGIYGTSGDAMMHCYLLDSELNNKDPKRTPPQLQSFMKEES